MKLDAVFYAKRIFFLMATFDLKKLSKNALHVPILGIVKRAKKPL